ALVGWTDPVFRQRAARRSRRARPLEGHATGLGPAVLYTDADRRAQHFLELHRALGLARWADDPIPERPHWNAGRARPLDGPASDPEGAVRYTGRADRPEQHRLGRRVDLLDVLRRGVLLLEPHRQRPVRHVHRALYGHHWQWARGSHLGPCPAF